MTRPSLLGQAAAVWGVAGVLAILLQAVLRLTPVGLEALRMPLSGLHYVGIGVTLVVMAYSEGYRGFQQQFSPRVVARARYLADHPTAVRVLLAPLFCMGFFHATRRRLMTSWIVASGIVGLITLVRTLPQPWRGIIDLGVVVGLAWGSVAIVVFAVLAMSGRPDPVPSDVPGQTSPIAAA